MFEAPVSRGRRSIFNALTEQRLVGSWTNVILAGYEIVGGLIGVGVMIWLRSSSPSSLPWGSFAAAVSPFGLNAAAGIALLRRQPAGYALSLVMQLVQVPFWTSPAAVWKLSAGFIASVWAIGADVHTFVGYDFTLFVGRGDVSQGYVIGVNFFPAIIVGGLIRIHRVTARRRE